ncbi:MAG: hypothetical protein NVV72_18715 [Asticcacaulis sp.]|nr:hypothetical protein [Asticcacaulis sp.]
MRADFSVMKALKAAVAFLPQAWAGVWLVLVLLFAVLAGGPWLLSGQQLPLRLAPFILIFCVLLLKLVSQGALYRIALFGKEARAEGLGFGGVQIGRPELRLLLAALIAGAFVLLIAGAIFLVFAIALSLSGLAAGYESSMAAVCAIWRRHSGADYMFIVYIAAAVLFLVFVALKFVLMPAANIGGRKLVALNALGLSTGNVGRLFTGLMAIILPFALACGLAVRQFGHGSAFIWLHSALLALSIFGLFPLIVGFLASAYRQIMAIRSK